MRLDAGKLAPLSRWISASAYHVGIEVPDIEEGLRFYRDLLGFEEEWHARSSGVDSRAARFAGIPGAEVVTVMLRVPGGSRIELQQYVPQGTVGGTAANNQGLNHLSFGVTDIWSAYEYLIGAGVKFRSPPVELPEASRMHGWIVTYFEDPWGTTLELVGPARTLASTGETPSFT
jgi:glyoxylase I family protein